MATTITDYTTLLSAISNHLHRTDLTAVIPDFVSFVEETANNGDTELDIPPLRTGDQETIWTSASTVPAVCTANSNYVTLPSDYMEMRQLYVTNDAGIRQELKRTSTIPMLAADRVDVSNLPQWFFESAGQLYLVPKPSQAFALHGIYYGKVAALSATNTTNWLLTKSPRLYLYGACMYASPWLGTDNRISIWAQGFKGAINGLNKADKRKRFGNAILRTELADSMSPGPYSIYAGLNL